MTVRRCKLLVLLFLARTTFGASAGWQALPNTQLKNVCANSGSCGAVVGAWSGGMADTMRNRLIIWGGGHGDYNGNEVYALDLNANPPTLTMITAQSPVNPVYMQCPDTLPDGNPNGRHTYNGLTYLPGVDKMAAFGGALSCGPGQHAEDLWMLDLGTLQWQRMDPVNGAPGQQPKDYYTPVPNMLSYDPTHPTAPSVFVCDVDSLWKYDYPTNTYTLLNLDFKTAYNSTPVVDPGRKLVFYFGNANGGPGDAVTSSGNASLKVLDISAGSTYVLQDWTSQVTGCDGLLKAYNPGVAYDTLRDKIVGWPNFGNTVYIFDPVNKSCTTQTFPGGPPDSLDYNRIPYTTGTFGRFQYFPALDAFALVNFWTNDAYLLRLPAPGGPSVPTINSFSASPGAITSGQSSILSWDVSNAAAIAIAPGTFSSNSASGSTTVSPSATTVYTLTATNAVGSVSTQRTLTFSQPTAALPTISPNGGSNLTPPQMVTLACATTNAQIYYTLDGSNPTQSSTLYNAPFSISSNVIIKAIAYGSGLAPSAVTAPATFSFATPPGTAATPSITPPGGTFTTSTPVMLQSATPNAFIYYTLDGSIPTLASPLYSGPFNLAQNATVKAFAQASGLSPSSVMTAVFTFSSGGGLSSLPIPDLSALPSYAGLNDTLSVHYDSTLNVSFLWNFSAANKPVYPAPALKSRGAGASFNAGARTQALSSYGLTPGTYQVSVQAVDNSNSANKSNSATAAISLVVSDFSQVKVYPNPWRIDKHATKNITFANLPIGSTVKLFTVSGHQVKTIGEVNGTANWDLKNDKGDSVASGVYLYLITVGDTGYGGNAQKLKGKLAIIK